MAGGTLDTGTGTGPLADASRATARQSRQGREAESGSGNFSRFLKVVVSVFFFYGVCVCFLKCIAIVI